MNLKRSLLLLAFIASIITSFFGCSGSGTSSSANVFGTPKAEMKCNGSACIN